MVIMNILLLVVLVPMVTATDSEIGYDPYGTMTSDMTAIFHKYDARYRSHEEFPNRLPVDVHATLHHIHGPDEDNQELKAVISLVIEWEDDRLKWNAQHWFSIIRAKLDDMWYPYMVYDNSVHNSEQPSKPKVAIHNDSLIVWKRLDTVTTFCQDLSNPAGPTSNEYSCKIILAFPILDEYFRSVTFVKRSNFQHKTWNIGVSYDNRNSEADLVLSLTRTS